ncbi:MAG: nuclear transport factor 2 family protein [Chloroflexota bacterium]|nr:nuclear transport factor 2 family protein [Chloroflexota bacterium]
MVDMYHLAAMNEAILHAEEVGLPDQIEPHLHEDFTIVRASGKRETRQAFLEAVPSNAQRGRRAEAPEIHLYGDCAVVSVRVSTAKNPDGSEVLRSFWNTRVFIRQDGEWRCVVWQVTEDRVA